MRNKLASPYFPIIILLIDVAVNYIINTYFYDTKIVSNLIEYKNKIFWLIIFFVVLWLFYCFWYSRFSRKLEEKDEIIREKEKENTKLDTVNNKLQSQIDKNALAIASKYGKLSDSMFSSVIVDILFEILSNNIFVDSIQVYTHEMEINEDTKDIDVFINYLCGYIKKNKTSNCIMQQKYTVKLNVFKSIIDCIDKLFYAENKSENNDISDELYEHIIKEVQIELLNCLDDIVDILKKQINLILDDDYTSKLNIQEMLNEERFLKFINTDDYDSKELDSLCDNYRIFLTLIELLGYNYNAGISDSETNGGYIDEILKHKRTGVLTSVITNDLYIFEHPKCSIKQDRIYASFPLKLFNTNYIFLASFNKEFKKHIETKDLPMYELQKEINKITKNILYKLGINKNNIIQDILNAIQDNSKELDLSIK